MDEGNHDDARVGYRAALRVPLVRRLTGATTASVIGDYLGVGALLVMGAERAGGSPLGTAAVLAAAVPAVVLVGAFGGPLLDRLPRKRTLVLVELLGAALICLPLLVDGLAVVFVTAALLAGQRTVTGAIRYGLIAEQLAERHRAPLLAMSSGIDQAGQVVGYLAGAAVYLLVSAQAALLLDAASFVLAAAILAGLRVGRTQAPTATSDEPDVPAGTFAGVRVIHRDPVLRLLTPLVLVTALVGVLPETLAPAALAGSDGRTALLLAAAPAGQALTIVLLGRTRVVARPWFQLGHLVALAAALALAASARGAAGLIAANVLVGAGIAWVLGPQLTFLRRVPPVRIAQVTGLMWAAIAVAEGIGALAFAAVADSVGVTTTYLLAAGVVLAATVPGLLVARTSRALGQHAREVAAEQVTIR